MDFNAGGHYDLDAVTSSVLRVGARYILKREKWNFYAGAAYEHEFDGKANGTADGMAIRGADTSGGSFRGELGATVKPGENSPWNIYRPERKRLRRKEAGLHRRRKRKLPVLMGSTGILNRWHYLATPERQGELSLDPFSSQKILR